MARLGNTEPRIWTPPLRELTPETTFGFDVIQFAEDFLEVNLLPWEKWLYIHALEIVGDFESEWRFRFRVVLVLVARQNGKTVVGKILALAFLYLLCASLILGLAQDLTQAEEVWQAAVDDIEDCPELLADVDKILQGKGSKELRLTDHRRYKAATPNRKNTRGKTANLVLMDELREQQTWDAWNAASKTIKAVASAIVWCMSNAGDGTSVVLRHLRTQAHLALGDPDGVAASLGDAADIPEDAVEALTSSVAIFEWSAAPWRDVWDRDGWAEANPSMGYGFLSEQSIAVDAATDTGAGFRTEDLCQWVETSVHSPFPDGSWERGTDEESSIAPDSPLSFGVDVASDRSRTSVAVCGLRADRSLHVELIKYEPGTRWLAEWFRNLAAKGPVRVALQANGAPVSAQADILGAIDGVEVVECAGRNLAAWCGGFWEGIAVSAEGSELDAVPIHHRPQPRLDVAASCAVTKPLGDGAWVFNRDRSAEDVSPLIACAMAHGLATMVEEKPVESAYEEYDPLFF